MRSLGSQFSSHLPVALLLFFFFFGEGCGRRVRRQYGVTYSFLPIFIYLGFMVPGSVLAACGGYRGESDNCSVLREATASCWQQNIQSFHKHPLSACPVPGTRLSDTWTIIPFLRSFQCGGRAPGF